MSKPDPVAPAVLCVKEACAYTRLCRTVLYELMKIGRVRYKMFGRKRLILVASLDELLSSLPDR